MHRPTLVTAPAAMPVTLEDVKSHLRVDSSDDDAMLNLLIASATDHLDGWTGVLGRCIVEQTWQQDFDAFARDLPLPLGPVISISSVTARNAAGQVSTIASTNYCLRVDDAGNAVVRFDADYDFPTDLHESRAVAVTYKAGYGTVPPALKTAIILAVKMNFEPYEAADLVGIRRAVDSLVAPFRRVGI